MLSLSSDKSYNNGYQVGYLDGQHKAADRLLWLQCLEEAGVDNWDGIDEAVELYERSKNAQRKTS